LSEYVYSYAISTHEVKQKYICNKQFIIRPLSIVCRTIQTIVENVHVWLVGPRRPVSACYGQ